MNSKKFYNQLWQKKEVQIGQPAKQRDIFHRYLLDHLVNPTENPRGEVTLGLITEPVGKLLDIGCWKGGFIQSAIDGRRCQFGVGVDIVEAAVQAANHSGITTIVHDSNDGHLPFPNGTFDCVSILGVLEHLFDPYFVMSEIHRVVKPNGLFFISVPNSASFSNRVRLLFGRELVTSLDPGWDGGHLHYFTVHSLRELVQNYGFKVETIAGTGGKRYLREWWPSLLLGEFIFRCRRL